MNNLPKQLGIIGIEVIVAIALILSATYFLAPRLQSDLTQTESSPAPIESASATPVLPPPSPTVTLKPSATPKPTTIPALTPKPISGPPGSGYSRITVKTEVGDFGVSVVSIDMAGVRMITDTANDDNCSNDCSTLSLSDFVTRNGGFAGINGSYFCPAAYPDCQDKKNSFDFPVYNTRLGKWINQDKLFWDNRALIYQDGGGIYFKKEAKSFGGSLLSGITNYPSLLEGGNITVGDYTQSDKQQTKGVKGGIGIRGNIIYLVISSNVTMAEFAHIFKSLGAESALNLDGGGSAALWFGGYSASASSSAYKVGPGRLLPNAIIFAR